MPGSMITNIKKPPKPSIVFIFNMSEVEMEVVPDSSEEIRKKKINFLKATLNIYRSRALSLKSSQLILMEDVVVPEEMINNDFVREQICNLYNDFALLTSFRLSLNLILNSITCFRDSNVEDPNLRWELEKTVSELSFFSQSVKMLYEERINEIDIIQRKQNYSSALADYQRNLSVLQQKQRELMQTAEDAKRLQKAEVQVHKINFIREMKMILIGKFGGNSEQFQSLQELRTSFRRNLTVDDFNETWNVGLSSS